MHFLLYSGKGYYHISFLITSAGLQDLFSVSVDELMLVKAFPELARYGLLWGRMSWQVPIWPN